MLRRSNVAPILRYFSLIPGGVERPCWINYPQQGKAKVKIQKQHWLSFFSFLLLAASQTEILTNTWRQIWYQAKAAFTPDATCSFIARQRKLLKFCCWVFTPKTLISVTSSALKACPRPPPAVSQLRRAESAEFPTTSRLNK